MRQNSGLVIQFSAIGGRGAGGWWWESGPLHVPQCDGEGTSPLWCLPNTRKPGLTTRRTQPERPSTKHLASAPPDC